MENHELSYCEDSVRKHLAKVLTRDLEFLEVRITGNRIHENRRFHFPMHGIFNDISEVLKIVREYSGHCHVYITQNKIKGIVKSSLPMNRLIGGRDAVKDKDIESFRNIYIDVDPVKPHAGISSTRTEMENSYDIMMTIKEFLVELGVKPSVVSTGNGYSLDISILAEEDTEKFSKDLKRLYQTLNLKFGNEEKATVDTSVHNASRIKKIIGTKAVKGLSSEERPHRIAKYLEITDQEPIDFYKIFGKFIAEESMPKVKVFPKNSKNPKQERKNGINVTKKADTQRWNGDFTIISKDILLEEIDADFMDLDDKVYVPCPRKDEHSCGEDLDSSSSLFFKDGRLTGYRCLHNSHSNMTIRDFLGSNLEKAERIYKKSIEESWGKPTEVFVKETSVFPVDSLPDSIKRFLLEFSSNLQVPLGGLFIILLSLVSTCLRGKWSVEVKKGYSETMILWTMWIAVSGARKSPSWNLLRKPLERWELNEFSKMQARIKRRKSEILSAESIIKNRRNKLSSVTDKLLLDEKMAEISAMEVAIPKELSSKRLFAQDTTPEAVPRLLDDNDNAIGLLSDEGGMLETFMGRYSSSGSDLNIDNLLQGYTGSGVIKVDRVKDNGQPIIVNNPSITIGFSPQPMLVAKHKRNQLLRSKGFIARFLAVYASGDIGSRRFIDTNIDDKILDDYNCTIDSILKITDGVISGGKDKTLRLSKKSFEVWKEYQYEIESDLSDEGELSDYRDYGAKWPGQILRLAGVLTVLETGGKCNEISDETMRQAISIGRYLLKQGIRLIDDMCGVLDLGNEDDILDWVLNMRNGFSSSDFYNRFRSVLKSAENCKPILKKLEDANWLRRVYVKQKGRGRPTIRYLINPILFN